MARQMKDSGIEWIGEIPEGWRTCKIKDIFQVVSGATPKSEQPEYWDGDIVWVTPADYKTNDKFVSSGKRTLTQAGYDSCGTTLVPAGSIVFSKRAPIGSVAIAQVPLCTNQGCLSCINRSDADTTFFYYVMSIFTEIFELYGSGTTFKELSFDNFASFAMPNPDSSEQQRIAAFLDHQCAEIDAVIERTKATIEEYKKLKQAVITEAVTKGVRGPRPMKDSGIEWIGEIPEEWEVAPLKYFITGYKAGPFGSSLITDKLNSSGTILVYTPEHVAKKTAELEFNLYLPDERREEMQQFVVTPGDIIFPIVGSLGRSMLVTDDMPMGIINQRLAKFRLSASTLVIEYFLWLFSKSSFYNTYIDLNCRGSIIVNLTKQIVYDMPVPHPMNLSEQAEIVAYLNEKCAALDTLIAKKTALLTELETYKKSLIYEYVTGKKEVEA